MKEVKFRAKSLYDDQWVYGYYVKRNGYEKGMIYEPNGLGHDVNPKTVGEYIGLRDKNEKEIYEGDIINFGGITPITIEWVEGGFEGMMDGLKFLKLNQAGLKAFAGVEGNIHEHSELLTI